MNQTEEMISQQEPGHTKKPSCLQINVMFWLVSLLLTVIYHISKGVLGSFSIYYRTWIIVIGEAITFLIMPVSLLLIPVTGMIFAAHHQKSKSTSTILAIVSVAMGIIIVIYIGIGSFVYLVSRSEVIEKESFLTADLIEGITEKSMGWDGMSSRSYRYYDVISLFLKKEHQPFSDIMEIKLGMKYNESFVAWETGDNAAKADSYTLHLKDKPDLVVHMLSGESDYGLMDDYPKARAHYLISQNEGMKKMNLVTPQTQTDGIWNGFVKGSVVTLLSKEEAWDMAEAAAEAIREVLEDKFFEENGHYASLYIKCQMEDGLFEEVEIPFGNMNDGVVHNETNNTITTADFYTDPPNIYHAIMGSYETYQTAEQEIVGPDVTTPVTIEGAYRCLYEEIFEPIGDAYNNHYNAKGNFYGILSEGKGKLNDETEEMDTRRTVVYDRRSKNNLCHIFVSYETYYNKDGSEYTTAIRNTYAVSMDAGKVTASGKQAWEDTGSKEFQAAAGEP